VLVAPLRPAQQIGEDAALVDVLSGGRLELGMGTGYLPGEFAAFGADFHGRGRTLRRRIGEVRRCGQTDAARRRRCRTSRRSGSA
jgi:alkanesulfonate monooxygenase SsuD/methylene tetrahydromethanopterin reductase-like flavin-dependent oxidoreductase (luciferase family)